MENKNINITVMFPYPSGEGLHIGHYFNYAIMDSYCRYKRYLGYNVFQPIGYDSFGLPAENYARKVGGDAREITHQNIDNFRKQMKQMDTQYDEVLVTSDLEYQLETQGIFKLLLNRGLAYKKEGSVDYCTSCETTLAREQVKQGSCERCNSPIQKRVLNQWYFKITDYKDRLIKNLDIIDYPEKTKKMQRAWLENLHDWCVSRQRKWGCSIPIEGEKDTLDTFVDSSFYYIVYQRMRGITPKPVDLYVGGSEHACMHLIYARFICMVMFDAGLIDFEEPFKKVIHQGMILKDGEKMSKCFKNGMELTSFKGLPVKVEDIKVGDELMGTNNEKRTVLKTYSGRDVIYKISPKRKLCLEEDLIFCTQNHILVLCYKGKTIEITVKEYLNSHETFKKQAMLMYSRIDMEDKYIPIDPYYLGLWLGDGTSVNTSITTMDCEVIEYLKNYFLSFGLGITINQKANNKAMTIGSKKEISALNSFNLFCFNEYEKLKSVPIKEALEIVKQRVNEVHNRKLHTESIRSIIKRIKKLDKNELLMIPTDSLAYSTKSKNPILNILNNYNLLSNKHIPNDFKYNSRQKRLSLLAGLIDSDGHFHKDNSVRFSNNNKTLIEDVAWVSKSLGFNISIGKNKKSYNLLITGNIQEIPLKIKRKKLFTLNKSTKNPHFTFNIELLKEEDFTGIEVDGNNRLLTKGLIVTHNSKGNTISPDDYDSGALRFYLMFLGHYFDGGSFKDDNFKGIPRFINKMKNWLEKSGEEEINIEEFKRKIFKYTEDFKFNKVVSEWMILLNNNKNKHLKDTQVKELKELLTIYIPNFNK
jgi:cysteinyl-tRNA synthetase